MPISARSFMNLWFIILLAFGFFQSIILNILTTPPNEWGARLTQAFDENSSYFSDVLAAHRLCRAPADSGCWLD